MRLSKNFQIILTEKEAKLKICQRINLWRKYRTQKHVIQDTSRLPTIESFLGMWKPLKSMKNQKNTQTCPILRHPPHFFAWSKIGLGWITPTFIKQPGVCQVPQAELPGAVVYKIMKRFSYGEYLLIENRQAVGLDQKIPYGSGDRGGLAIWHIDETKKDVNNAESAYPGVSTWPPRHYRIALLQADRTYDLEKGSDRGDAHDVYRAGFKTEIGKDSTPSTRNYNGSDAKYTITEMKETMFSALGTGALGGILNKDERLGAPRELRLSLDERRRLLRGTKVITRKMKISGDDGRYELHFQIRVAS